MNEKDREAFSFLEKHKNDHTRLYYGAMKVRITGLDIRRGRLFISMEEPNGTNHDYDKDMADVPAFISRLRLSPTIEVNVDIITFDDVKRKAFNAKEYDVVSVWVTNKTPKFLVFSTEFSNSDFLKKNKRFYYGKKKGEPRVVYLYPDNDKGFIVTKKTPERFGLSVSKFYHLITERQYTIELVIINGKEALKLLPIV